MKVKSNFLFLIFCSFAIPVFPQQKIKSYVQKNYKSIRTVDVLDSNYNDLETIGKAIGDKRIVMLGEQDHGDVPTFFAKTRLIKYLHEKKGFNVLAFESDFFSLNNGQVEIRNGAPDFIAFMKQNIFGIWTRCKACKDLFYNYLPSQFMSPNKIMVTGFDSQPHGHYADLRLSSFLDSILTSHEWNIPDLTDVKDQLKTLTDSLTFNWGRNVDFEKLDTVLNSFLSIIEQYEKRYGNDFAFHVLNSIFTTAKQAQCYYKNDFFNMVNLRDRQMAKNLDWLTNEKHKNEKIIIWAANFHTSNNSHVAHPFHIRSMGTEFLAQPKNAAQTYSIGFTSHSGTAGQISLEPCIVQQPEKRSFENWFGNKEFAFIDFTAYNRRKKDVEFFKMKPFGHGDNIKAQWTKVFNGVFYIRNMYDCKTYNSN